MQFKTTVALGLAFAMFAAPGCKDDDDSPAPAPAPTLGNLVSTFGTGGVVTVNPSTRQSEAVAVVSDGTHIYVIGYDEMTNPNDYQWRIEKRLASTGALVSGFGTGGVQVSNPSSGDDQPLAAAHDGTDLYIVGYDSSAGNKGWRFEKRSMGTGATVNTFGASGVIAFNPSTRGDEPEAVVVAGGNLYVVGFDESPAAGDTQWRIEKRSASTGALDGTFGGGSGVLTLDHSSAGGGGSAGDDQALTVLHDGTDLYVGGYDETNGGGDLQWRIEKRDTTNGNLVSSFGSSGVLALNPGPGQDAVLSLAADSSDLYAFGAENTMGGGIRVRVEKRSLSDGTLVTTFGSGGVITADPTPSGVDLAGGLVSGTDLYVAGTANAFGTDSSWFVQKRSATTGALDAGFGAGGIITVNPSAGYDSLSDGLTVGATDMIIVGTDSSAGSGNEQWRIERRTR